MQDGMTRQDQDDYNEGMKEWAEAEKELYEQDAAIMRDVKKLVTTEKYASIEQAIDDSEKTSNYRIIGNHIGEHCIDDDQVECWVDQRAVGISGDSWEGTVCVEISSHKYIMWDFEM